MVWPRPMVYLPALTPSNFSSSAWSTHCRLPVSQPSCWRVYQISGAQQTYLAGHVQLDGLDADVLGPLRHDVCLLGEDGSCGRRRRRGRVRVLFLSSVRCARGCENNGSEVGLVSNKGEVSPWVVEMLVAGAQGEFRMEMGTGEGEREQEKDGMGIITILSSTWQRRHALAHGGDFGSARCASANEANLGKWFDVLHLLEHQLVPR